MCKQNFPDALLNSLTWEVLKQSQVTKSLAINIAWWTGKRTNTKVYGKL